ncbi:MAG: ABC transporter permease [Ostreibacterium sp.]
MKPFKRLLNIIAIATILLLLWQAIIWFFSIPHYIMATPFDVFSSLINHWQILLKHASVTLTEILLGLLFGFTLGVSSAILLSTSRKASAILMPVLVLSQAIPVFAIAPVLVLWLGFGMVSKVVMAALVIYFPVTAACFDGLRNTPTQWIAQAQSMKASPLSILFHIRLPAALPSLASGLRIATSFAPIGAIIGEWIGSAQGLGYLMLQANARMQIDTVFAALLVLMVISLTLYFTIDKLLNRYIPWAKHLN